MYLELRHCSFFQIQPELILLIWDIMLTEKWPNHKEVQTLKQRPLGKLITLSGPRSLARDLCSYYKGFIRIVAIYIKYVQCGINYNSKQVLCSATVRGYTKAVNNLFKLRCFSPPANLPNPNNMMAILLNNMLQEEDIARQGAPHDNNFFPSYIEWPQPANARIQSMTSFLTSWLSVATSGFA
jgi:hypothetical protein